MSSIDDTEAAINAAVDGPEPEETEVEEVESGADDGSAESEPILGKFKSQDDLVKAYQELERQFTQQRQAEPEVEEEPEQPFDVWGGLGSTMDEETERQVAARVYQDPAGMMRWAEHPETTAQFGPQITARVYATWQQFDPYGAARYAATKAAEEMVTQPRQELEQLQQQWFQQQHKAESGEGVRWAEANLPDWETYKPQVLALYEQYTQGDEDPRIQNYAEITRYLKQLYSEVRTDEFIAAAKETAAQAQDTGAGKKARTQTRSTATPTTGAPMEDDQFLAEVLAGQPGQH